MKDRMKNWIEFLYGKNVKWRWVKIILTILAIVVGAMMLFNVTLDLGWFKIRPIDPSKFKAVK